VNYKGYLFDIDSDKSVNESERVCIHIVWDNDLSRIYAAGWGAGPIEAATKCGASPNDLTPRGRLDQLIERWIESYTNISPQATYVLLTFLGKKIH